MTRETEAVILLAIAGIVGRLTLDGGYQAYVKPGLYVPLLLSVAALLAVGVASWLGKGDVDDGHAELHGVELVGHDEHEHVHRSRVGLLLLVPVAVLALVAPAPLGAFAVDRVSANQFEQPSDVRLPPLPEPVDGAVDLTIGQLVVRAYHGEPDETDVPVRLRGFVVHDPRTADGFILTRFAVSCCAVDASARQVLVTDVGRVPLTNQWVEVVATWTGQLTEERRLPVLRATSVAPIPEPERPYEL